MLRLLTQSHSIMMSPLILSFVSKSNTTDILRLYFLPPSILNRQFHIFTGDLTKIDECKMMAAKKGKKEKSSKPSKTKKKSDEECEEEELGALEHGGSCPPRLTPPCCVTLRPEDATAAACAAKVAEAAARRAALASKKSNPQKLKKPVEPMIRERLCATAVTKKPKLREKIEPTPEAERVMPQSTKPWVHSRYEDISKKLAKSPIAVAYRPVTKPIRVCTPQEVRKIFAPKPKPCKPLSKHVLFRQRVKRLIMFASKIVIAACVVMFTVDLGIWDSSDSATELLSTLIYGNKDKLFHLEYLGYSLKEKWNTGVRNIFYVIGKLIPSMADRVNIGSSQTEADQQNYLTESPRQ